MEQKRVLLIDRADMRRGTRVQMLERAGYEIVTRDDWISAEQLDHEGHFDLVLVALDRAELRNAAAYSDRLARSKPTLPILLVTDAGAFAPRGTLSASVESGNPPGLMNKVAAMLAGSSHIRELEP